MEWRVYYGDGSTFDSAQGPPEAAPSLNIQVIAQQSDITIGRQTVTGDFYWWDGRWFGGDIFGLWDYLARVSPSIVKFGRVLSRPEFDKILVRAVTDPDLMQKVAWDSREVKPAGPDPLS